jgi:hypothetical protein
VTRLQKDAAAAVAKALAAESRAMGAEEARCRHTSLMAEEMTVFQVCMHCLHKRTKH